MSRNVARLVHIYIFMGGQNWHGGPVLAAKIGVAGPILTAKVVQGPILVAFSAKISPAGPILGGPILS